MAKSEEEVIEGQIGGHRVKFHTGGPGLTPREIQRQDKINAMKIAIAYFELIRKKPSRMELKNAADDFLKWLRDE